MACSRSVIIGHPALERLASIKPRPLTMMELPPSPAPVASFPVERRNIIARERLVTRVRAEFHDMPGLTLTVPQAGRLFGIAGDACTRILATLVREGLLRRQIDGTYSRSDARP
jgi:hypothetical protein